MKSWGMNNWRHTYSISVGTLYIFPVPHILRTLLHFTIPTLLLYLDTKILLAQSFFRSHANSSHLVNQPALLQEWRPLSFAETMAHSQRNSQSTTFVQIHIFAAKLEISEMRTAGHLVCAVLAVYREMVRYLFLYLRIVKIGSFKTWPSPPTHWVWP